MYRIKNSIDLKLLEKYGFKIGREIPDNERCICNDFERDDYWIIPMSPDEPDEIYYANEEFDQPIWSIHVQPIDARYTSHPYNRLIIDCTPSYTYHISNMDMEQMFYALYCMIKDNIIEDDFETKGFIETDMDLKLTRSECDLIIDCLKPREEELGMDITLLIDKIERHKNIAPEQVLRGGSLWIDVQSVELG